MIANRRTGTLSLTFALCFLAAGCIVENEHSIVDKPAPFDRRLPGVWALEADGNAQVLVLRAREDDGNQLGATFVIVDKDDPPLTSRAAISFTSIDGHAFFEADWEPGEWLPIDPPVRRAFGTFEISGSDNGETLKVCFADSESFEAPLKRRARRLQRHRQEP